MWGAHARDYALGIPTTAPWRERSLNCSHLDGTPICLRSSRPIRSPSRTQACARCLTCRSTSSRRRGALRSSARTRRESTLIKVMTAPCRRLRERSPSPVRLCRHDPGDIACVVIAAIYQRRVISASHCVWNIALALTRGAAWRRIDWTRRRGHARICSHESSRRSIPTASSTASACPNSSSSRLRRRTDHRRVCSSWTSRRHP